MPVAIDYERARGILEEIFQPAENDLREGSPPPVPQRVGEATQVVFGSVTQAYREVLLGCALARLQDRTINIRLPYVKHGPNAFNGRTLDEKVVNPFLQEKRIPSSRGAFLSVFRRSVQFTEATREGLRDQAGYDAFLRCITYLESIDDDRKIAAFIRHLLYRFAELREAATIPITQLHRISLDQYADLLDGLLSTPSGGRFPVLVVVATFEALKEYFRTDWKIEKQGINVADAASGAGGDVTIKEGDRIVLAAEVTEREISKSRVVSTFQTKIAPNSLEDYLFFLKGVPGHGEVRDQAARYFAQGHEMNFVDIRGWILMILATIGSKGRAIFNQKLIELLSAPEIPAHVKTAWNDQLTRVIG